MPLPPPYQGDQMSLEKIAQNVVAQPVFRQNFVTTFTMGKGGPKLGLLVYYLNKTAQNLPWKKLGHFCKKCSK
jgi:hypothetical protein